MDNVLIYGFGRMGLTHYSILNKLTKAKFTFVDPSFFVKFIASRNVIADVHPNDSMLDQPFDYTLICTPPMYHISTLKKSLRRGDGKIFVEKPFGANDDFRIDDHYEVDHVSVGYVLRYNPVVKWFKSNIDLTTVEAVECSYNSNTIEKKPKGWRNSSYSGVANEMGSHLIDLCLHIFGLSEVKIMHKKVLSVLSDVDDIVTFDCTSNGLRFHFNFNWVNPLYRKPVFEIKVKCKDGITYVLDQQRVVVYRNGEFIRQHSCVDISASVPFYLRGVEFTSQMQDFLGESRIATNVDEANQTRTIINSVLK
jgi:predicted dehydrogenase